VKIQHKNYNKWLNNKESKMAITWSVTITPLDVTRKEAAITAIRKDTVTGKEQRLVISSVILSTTQQKIDALNQLWQMHLDYEALQAQIATYIGTLENDAKANLEARE
jgi:hypothetical protein